MKQAATTLTCTALHFPIAAVRPHSAMSKCADLNQHLSRWGAISQTVIALVLSSATGCTDTLSHRDIKPPCESPAPLEGRFDSRAPGFIIELQPAADVVSVAHDLAIKYGFHVRTVGAPGTIFSAGPMTSQTVAALRCDSALKAISHDGYMVHLTWNSSFEALR
jgi:hypothetical protein